ncbi:MAG: trehalase family glycosidase [Melioribacteraceae bacterium]
MRNKLLMIYMFVPLIFISAQRLTVFDDYLKISAKGNDPLYTTYTASMERSRLYGDKGYKMDYYSDCSPITYSGDQAGKFYSLWKIDQVVVKNIGEYYEKPVVTASFPDMAIIEYSPFRGIKIQETFFVYSSSIVVVSINIKNEDKIKHDIEIYPVLELGNDSLVIKNFDKQNSAYVAEHHESKYRLISGLYKNAPYPTDTRDIFASNFNLYSFGGYNGDMNDFYNTIKTDFYSENRNDSLNHSKEGNKDFISLHGKISIQPDEEKNIKYFRGWQDEKESGEELISQINKLKPESLQKYLDANIKLFSRIPRIKFKSDGEKLIYLGAFNLVRGCILPPEGKTKYNYYVFSREPLWGWGHGHQVLHESLSMLAYAYLDPVSAQGSQYVYMEQQREDGLIAYRHGPRGMQDYPHFSKALNRDMSSTSAPFFNWINWEIYSVSKDKKFLNDAYKSGRKYINWLFENRDLDHDGTFEWGPYGLIENVRDWYNAVFQVSAERYLDVDKEDISDELECLDLTVMIIKELRSLSKIAGELSMPEEAKNYQEKADTISQLVNERMWDNEKIFFFSINKEDQSFKFMSRDLRREEIIGFLPLWAEAVDKERAALLIDKLTDTTKFWRKYGVPTLAADDEWFTPYVDYCCKWNGPVWLLWDYMVYDGLRNYGYEDIANQLADRMINAAAVQLRKNHNFWESYSPDNEVLNSPPNYIWDSILAKLLIDKYMRLQ